jgi:hypothetical protein
MQEDRKKKKERKKVEGAILQAWTRRKTVRDA